MLCDILFARPANRHTHTHSQRLEHLLGVDVVYVYTTPPPNAKHYETKCNAHVSVSVFLCYCIYNKNYAVT